MDRILSKAIKHRNNGQVQISGSKLVNGMASYLMNGVNTQMISTGRMSNFIPETEKIFKYMDNLKNKNSTYTEKIYYVQANIVQDFENKTEEDLFKKAYTVFWDFANYKNSNVEASSSNNLQYKHLEGEFQLALQRYFAYRAILCGCQLSPISKEKDTKRGTLVIIVFLLLLLAGIGYLIYDELYSQDIVCYLPTEQGTSEVIVHQLSEATNKSLQGLLQLQHDLNEENLVQ